MSAQLQLLKKNLCYINFALILFLLFINWPVIKQKFTTQSRKLTRKIKGY